MAQILKFPAQASKLGYRPVKKRAKLAEHPDQLALFAPPGAQILSFAPDLSPFEQALVCDERGDLKAAELYEKAIEKQDCIADAYCNLGIIETKKGNTTKAFGCFTTSLKHDPRHSESHYNLGNLYFDLNDFRLAQIHYELAVEVDSSFANAYFNLALIQAINDDFAAALGALARYQQLVSEEEGRIAGELLHNLRQSLGGSKSSRIGST
jgi:tetratricopeptide (TPR) repeat protein